MDTMRITGGRVLLPEGEQTTDLLLADGRIAAIGSEARGGPTFDARGLRVLPGIVDIHGDAFERQLQPRPGVDFPPDIALADTEAQLLANGITTAFHGITLSWEPGLRSLDGWVALLAALRARPWTCDMRVHLRWEAFNLDALDTALADIGAGHVDLVAFNDHTPSILKKIADPVAGAKYSDRAGMKLEAFRTLAERIGGRADAVPGAQARIAAAARDAGIPLASHDDATVPTRTAFRELGARICEFPMAEEVGEAARNAGDWVVMGSPNVVRGRSHIGWASAARLAEAGICNVLSSDYYYPAMLRAALILAGRGVLDLAQAWALISTNPARAAGLSDRGIISPGKRADLVVLDANVPQAVATIAAGRIAFLAPAGAERLSARM
ncbi:MAG TPA: alpha-D-ribose 1-methylphosphonate 5-triphosphate diphosphatase [Acetobacteraceae bacterium]|jgi:alpha-D-ribose 1-methylphosphonate 5-triphosphate diphosphatase